MVHPDVVFLNQLLAFDKERIVNAASMNDDLRRNLVRWASELSSAATNALLVEGTRPDNPHRHCVQAGRCIARSREAVRGGVPLARSVLSVGEDGSAQSSRCGATLAQLPCHGCGSCLGAGSWAM